MVRSVVVVALLALMAVVGWWSTMAAYGLAATYADPTGSPLGSLAGFGGLAVLVAVVLLGLGLGAVAVGRRRWRRAVLVAAVAVALLALGGVAVGNRLGFGAKQVESSRPPVCGIGNAALDRAFRSVPHPGYFGGGSSSRTDCSYMLTARSTRVALAHYAAALRASSWQVSLTPQALTATRSGYRFTVVERTPVRGRDYLQVSLSQ